jgi:phospholipase/carboxylesterase
MLHQRALKAAEVCGFVTSASASAMSTLELCGTMVQGWQKASYRPVLRVRAKAAQSTPHTACVIFSHGLGDSGEGWAYSFIEMAERLPHILFLFPTARSMPVTCNGGMVMPSWYDIAGLDIDRLKMDAPGIEESAMFLQCMMELESYTLAKVIAPTSGEQPSSSNEPSYRAAAAGRIVLGGFSQGSALTMYAAHTADQRLGGMVVLSGYCTQLKELLALNTQTNRHTPLLMCHGTDDGVVPFGLAKESYHWATSEATGLRSTEAACNTFLPLDGVGHESSETEMAAVEAFIAKQLPPL